MGGVEQAFNRALATLDAAPEMAADVVRWFGQAQRRLPPETLASAPAERLSAVAALHVDRLVPDSILGADRLPDGVGAGAPSTLPTTEISVALTDDGLRFAGPRSWPMVPRHPAPDAAAGAGGQLGGSRPAADHGGPGGPRRRDPPARGRRGGLAAHPVGYTIPASASRAELSVDHALEMLTSLAVAFHVRAFMPPSVRSEDDERTLLSASPRG